MPKDGAQRRQRPFCPLLARVPRKTSAHSVRFRSIQKVILGNSGPRNDTDSSTLPDLHRAELVPRSVARRRALSSLRAAYSATTDKAFIRSEINGRQSRRMVLLAFFSADLIGATLWAAWCEERSGSVAEGVVSAKFGDMDKEQACGSFGMTWATGVRLVCCLRGLGSAGFYSTLLLE